MNYRLPVLGAAVLLVGVGLWLSVFHAANYMKINDLEADTGPTRRVIKLNEDGVPEVHFCNSLMCKSYSEVQEMYMGYFAASGGLFAFLFAWRRRTKAKSII
jgi:hypothetical protein